MSKISVLQLMRFNHFDTVEDTVTGTRYMVTPEWKLREIAPCVMEDKEFNIGMRLKIISTSVPDETTTYVFPTSKILGMERPIDMLEEDWKEFVDKNSYRVLLKHNSVFDDSSIVEGGVVAEEMVTHRFGFFDTVKNKFIYSDHAKEKDFL